MASFPHLAYLGKVRNRCHDQALLLSQLRGLIAGMFRADLLEPGKMGDRLCLDSLDLLELGIRIEEEFGVAILCAEESPSVFTSIVGLADFIHAHAGQPAMENCAFPAGFLKPHLVAGLRAPSRSLVAVDHRLHQVLENRWWSCWPFRIRSPEGLLLGEVAR